MEDLYIHEDNPEIISGCGLYVAFLEGAPTMKFYHMHSHYEISVITAGNVSVLLPETVSSGSEPKIVILQPFTLHQMIPDPNLPYRRINIWFTKEYVTEMSKDWLTLQRIFNRNGGVLLPDETQLHELEQVLSIMEKEKDQERNRYLLMYALSLLGDIRSKKESESEKFPNYVRQALMYFSDHFTEQITAEELAKRLGICRTALMNGFKSYMGCTMHQYQQSLRLKYAEYLRSNGASVGEAAEASGFCDASGYIRAYRRVYGTTPTGKK